MYRPCENSGGCLISAQCAVAVRYRRLFSYVAKFLGLISQVYGKHKSIRLTLICMELNAVCS